MIVNGKRLRNETPVDGDSNTQTKRDERNIHSSCSNSTGRKDEVEEHKTKFTICRYKRTLSRIHCHATPPVRPSFPLFPQYHASTICLSLSLIRSQSQATINSVHFAHSNPLTGVRETTSGSRLPSTIGSRSETARENTTPASQQTLFVLNCTTSECSNNFPTAQCDCSDRTLGSGNPHKVDVPNIFPTILDGVRTRSGELS